MTAKKGHMTADEMMGILSTTLRSLVAGRVEPQEANAICNTSGKIIQVQRLQIDYYLRLGRTPKTKFLDNK